MSFDLSQHGIKCCGLFRRSGLTDDSLRLGRSLCCFLRCHLFLAGGWGLGHWLGLLRYGLSFLCKTPWYRQKASQAEN